MKTKKASKKKPQPKQPKVEKGKGSMLFTIDGERITVKAALCLNPGQVMHLSETLQKQAMSIKLGLLKELAKESGIAV